MVREGLGSETFAQKNRKKIYSGSDVMMSSSVSHAAQKDTLCFDKIERGEFFLRGGWEGVL